MVSESLEQYIKEIDEACKEYNNLTKDKNSQEQANKTEKKIIGNLDNLIIELNFGDEAIVSKMTNKFYMEAIDSKEIMLKCCELAKKANDLSGREEIYIEALLKSMKYLNDSLFSYIIRTNYFKENYIYMINKIKNYMVQEKKYILMPKLVFDISELRCIHYKQILNYFIQEMNSTFDEKSIKKQKTNEIYRYILVRDQLIKTYQLSNIKKNKIAKLKYYWTFIFLAFILVFLFSFFDDLILNLLNP